MRTTKELLEIVLDEFENERIIFYGYSGICTCIHYLEVNNLITSEEKRFLFGFTEENRPKEGEYFCGHSEYYDYFWKPYLKAPRIAWLKHLIQKAQ